MRVTGEMAASGVVGWGVAGREVAGRDLAEPGARRVSTAPRRRVRTSGPRPARPGVVPTGTRPPQPARPAAGGPRVLVRSQLHPFPPHIRRRRRVATAIGTMLLTAAVVVLLGLLADAVATARQGSVGPSSSGYSLTGVAPALGQVPLTPLG